MRSQASCNEVVSLIVDAAEVFKICWDLVIWILLVNPNAAIFNHFDCILVETYQTERKSWIFLIRYDSRIHLTCLHFIFFFVGFLILHLSAALKAKPKDYRHQSPSLFHIHFYFITPSNARLISHFRKEILPPANTRTSPSSKPSNTAREIIETN